MKQFDKTIVALILGIGLLALTACESPIQPAVDNAAEDEAVGEFADFAAGARAGADYYIAPTFTGNNINKPYIGQSFRTGQYITWVWGGCTTLAAMLNDGATKELLLVDGYVSKAALGIDDFWYLTADKVDRVYAYAQFIANKVRSENYRIAGWVTTHSHADHVGDIPLLMFFLDKLLGYTPSFPLVVDGNVYADPDMPTLALGNLVQTPFGFIFIDNAFVSTYFTSRVTDVISFYQNGAAPAALSGINGKAFSDLFRLYNPKVGDWEDAIAGGLRAKVDPALELADKNNFALGNFRVRAFLFDHAGVPAFDMTGVRVVGYQVWYDNASGAKKTLIMDTTDDAGFIAANKLITTDYLFLSWVPTFSANDIIFTDIVNDRSNTAVTVGDHVRWTASTAIRYIVPLHVDDIAANSYEPKYPSDLWNVCSMPSVMRNKGLFPTFANNILKVSTTYFSYRKQSGIKLYFAVFNQRIIDPAPLP